MSFHKRKSLCGISSDPARVTHLQKTAVFLPFTEPIFENVWRCISPVEKRKPKVFLCPRNIAFFGPWKRAQSKLHYVEENFRSEWTRMWTVSDWLRHLAWRIILMLCTHVIHVMLITRVMSSRQTLIEPDELCSSDFYNVLPWPHLWFEANEQCVIYTWA